MRKLTVWMMCLLAVMAAGCADAGKPIEVALNLTSAQAIDQGQSLTINATVTNDHGGKGVTWSETGAGTLSNQTATSVTYSAPAVGANAKSKANGAAAKAEAAGGNASATVMATSVANAKDTASVAITVTPPPSVTTGSLPDATEGTAYNQPIAAVGGAGTLTYLLNTGNLPAGLALNGTTGAIAGTPTATGTSTFTVKVMDSSTAGPVSATSGSLSIKVDAVSAPAITTTSLPGGTKGIAYSQTVAATGGLAPLTFTISAGALPGGLGISSSGTISGMPTTTGTATFTVKVSDSTLPTAQTATKQLSIAINPGFSVTTSTLPNGTVGTAYSQQLASANGTAPVIWSLKTGSALPAGLGISSGGLISGTPTAAGTTSFMVQAVDSSVPAQTVFTALSITIAASTAGLCDPSNTGAESTLNGQYAMVLQGFNSVGTVAIGATFDADGAGHIAKTVGIEDVNTNTGQSNTTNLPIDSMQSSYTLGADHRGCLILVTPFGTDHYAFATMAATAGVATRAQVIETNLFDFVSGALYKQDTSAFATGKLNGSYAFGVAGSGTNGANRYAAVGALSLDGSGGVTGQMDINDRGNLNGNGGIFPSSAISISSGTYSVAASGRGTLAFSPAGAAVINAFIYVVSAQSFLILRSDAQGTAPLLCGDATLQSGKPYSSASMNATAAFGTIGTTPTITLDARVGLLVTSGVQHSITYAENPGGSSVFNGTASIPVSYTVDPSGRVVAANSDPGGLVVFYLSAANQGYMVFMVDAFSKTADTNASSGFFALQSGSPYTDLAFGGVNWSLGSLGGGSESSTHTAGWAQFAANPPQAGGVVTGHKDFVDGKNDVLGSNVAYSQKVFVNSDSGQIQWADNALATVSVGYFVSPTKIIAIDSITSAFPGLLYYEVQ